MAGYALDGTPQVDYATLSFIAPRCCADARAGGGRPRRAVSTGAGRPGRGAPAEGLQLLLGRVEQHLDGHRLHAPGGLAHLRRPRPRPPRLDRSLPGGATALRALLLPAARSPARLTPAVPCQLGRQHHAPCSSQLPGPSPPRLECGANSSQHRRTHASASSTGLQAARMQVRSTPACRSPATEQRGPPCSTAPCRTCAHGGS